MYFNIFQLFVLVNVHSDRPVCLYNLFRFVQVTLRVRTLSKLDSAQVDPFQGVHPISCAEYFFIAEADKKGCVVIDGEAQVLPRSAAACVRPCQIP